VEGLGKLKKFNDLNWTRTRDLPSCSILPQPTTLPLAPALNDSGIEFNFLTAEQIVLPVTVSTYSYIRAVRGWNLGQVPAVTEVFHCFLRPLRVSSGIVLLPGHNAFVSDPLQIFRYEIRYRSGS
jgi:hypothetical protein